MRRPPEAWGPVHGAALALLRPVERFLSIQTSSGIVLLVSAGVALAWANSPWAESYEALWETRLIVELGPLQSSETLHFWVNDGLMVLFFLVVGLEVRRELHEGELSQLRRAALPMAAALGGMLAPAALYFALNQGSVHAGGWGVPMATDIAFAVGVLALLGDRVPPALRILLLALAIIDDIGAILVIAIFYSQGIELDGLLIAAAGILTVLALQRTGVRSAMAYVPAGVLVWLGMHHAHIHPTLAGVVLGLLTPVRAWLGEEDVRELASTGLREYHAELGGSDHKAVVAPLRRLSALSLEAVSPVVRLEANLHGWVAFGVMPLFALANAGVPLPDPRGLDSVTIWMVAGTALGLWVGKPLGILLASWLAVKLGAAALPGGVTWSGIAVVGLVGGVGFTMSLFIAALAHPNAEAADYAKLAVVAGSGLAAVSAWIAGRLFLSPTHPGAAKTAREAERSTTL